MRQELRNPAIYLTSAVIGFLIIWLMKIPSIPPFLVPFMVLLAANSMVRFNNRDVDTLLLLPGQREDPAFIMDASGNVVLSAGKTEHLLKKNSITKITENLKACRTSGDTKNAPLTQRIGIQRDCQLLLK